MKFIIWSLFEIYLFTLSVEHFGFLASVYFYAAPSIIGLLLLSSAQRRIVDQRAGLDIHSLALFLGCILLIIPSLTTRVFALVLVLPGLRHLFLYFSAEWLKNKLTQEGNIQFNFGGFSYGPGAQPFGRSSRFSKGDHRQDMDMEDVIDVTATHVSDEPLPAPEEKKPQ